MSFSVEIKSARVFGKVKAVSRFLSATEILS